MKTVHAQKKHTQKLCFIPFPSGLMVHSRAHPNQWAMGLILPPTKKSALECLSKWNLLLSNWGVIDLAPLQQVGASTVQEGT